MKSYIPIGEDKYKMTFLAQNRVGIQLLKFYDIDEENIQNEIYKPLTGVYAIIKVREKYLLGYNIWREQWEFPAGKIEEGETTRQAAIRELFEETHQKVDELLFCGLFKIYDSKKDEHRFRAMYYGEIDNIEDFVFQENDEMKEITLWDLKCDIGYIDEVDIKMFELGVFERVNL